MIVLRLVQGKTPTTVIPVSVGVVGSAAISIRASLVGISVNVSLWILASGSWDDAGIWEEAGTMP